MSLFQISISLSSHTDTSFFAINIKSSAHRSSFIAFLVTTSMTSTNSRDLNTNPCWSPTSHQMPCCLLLLSVHLHICLWLYSPHILSYSHTGTRSNAFKMSTKAKLLLSFTSTFFLHRVTTGAQLRRNTAVASQNTANTSRFPLSNRNQYLPVFIYSSEISSLVTLSIQPSFPFFSMSTFQRLLVFFCLSE